jgi:hypothetical protein
MTASNKSYAEYLHQANQRSLDRTGKPLYMPAGMKLTYTAAGKPKFMANMPVGTSKNHAAKPAGSAPKTRGKSISLVKIPKDYY